MSRWFEVWQVRRVPARFGVARKGVVGSGRLGKLRLGVFWFVMACFGLAGMVGLDLFRFGSVGYGLLSYGWLGSVS